MEFNREELAWAAGFIDGEGWIGAPKGTKSRCLGVLQLNVSQVDPFVLYRLNTALGSGKVSGPYKKGGRNNQPNYQFNICNFEHTQQAIASLWNWLSPVKKAQAKQALKDLENFRLEAKYKPRRRLTHKEKTAIITEWRQTNKSRAELAKQFAVSVNSVARVLRSQS